MNETLAPWLIVVALFLLHLGLRGIWHPWAQQARTLSFMGMIFAVGYAVGGSTYWGTVFVVSWFAWLIGRYIRMVRQWRATADTDLQPCRAPNSYRFPMLGEVSETLEELGFEELEDFGSEEGEESAFLRRFRHATERTQAVIVFQEVGEMAFFYLSLTTFTTSGEEWTTWNNPVIDALVLPPEVHLQPVGGVADESVEQMLEAHRAFFAAGGREAAEVPVECGRELLLKRMRRHIDYNVERGILCPAEQEGVVRYSWRGVWFALRNAWRR